MGMTGGIGYYCFNRICPVADNAEPWLPLVTTLAQWDDLPMLSQGPQVLTVDHVSDLGQYCLPLCGDHS
jgi:hypothetical protein